MIRYCVWDVGKTIYDYSLKPFELWAAAKTSNREKFRSAGGLRTYDFNPYMLGKITIEEMSREICRRCDIAYTDDTPEEVSRELRRGVGRYFPETRKMMVRLQNNGIENAVFSNALPVLAGTVSYDDVLKTENIFTSYQAGVLKPDPAAFEYVRARLGCRFDEMIMVDDKRQNIKSARSLGMHGIVFKAETIEEELEKIIALDNRENIEYCAFSVPVRKCLPDTLSIRNRKYPGR